MKRFVSLMLVVLLVASLFVGCSSTAASPEGTYKVKSIDGKDLKTYFTDSFKEQGIEEADLDSLLGLMGLSVDTLSDFMTITLNADGTVSVTSAMDDENSTGTWKLEGDQLTITADGEDQVFTLSGNELSADIEGMKMVLSK